MTTCLEKVALGWPKLPPPGHRPHTCAVSILPNHTLKARYMVRIEEPMRATMGLYVIVEYDTLELHVDSSTALSECNGRH